MIDAGADTPSLDGAGLFTDGGNLAALSQTEGIDDDNTTTEENS